MGNESVIFIGCDSRSGSTLLDHILSNSNEIMCVGEMSHLSEHLNRCGVGWSWDWVCTCRNHPEDCPFWSKVIKEYEKDEQVRLRDFDTSCKNSHSAKVSFLLSIIAFFCYSKKLREKILAFLYGENQADSGRHYFKIYKYVRRVSGSSIVLDSSKQPLYLYRLLKGMGEKGEKLKFIHLVRDARAVSLSKTKRAKQFGKRANYVYALLGWIDINLQLLNLKSILPLDSCITVSYEDLCENPEAVIKIICKKLNISYKSCMSKVQKQEKHNIGGSQHRFKGFGEIKLDQRWKSELTMRNKIAYYLIGGALNKYLASKIERP